MPPLYNMNCFVPRQKHSPTAPGILGPPRAVLPIALQQTVEACASTGASKWRFATNDEGSVAELQWPTGPQSKPFLTFPPPLLNLVDIHKLSKPSWSVDYSGDSLRCTLSWPPSPPTTTSAPESPFSGSRQTTPSPPQSSPATSDNGYFSSSPSQTDPPPTLPSPTSTDLAPIVRRLSYAGAVSPAKTAAVSPPPRTSPHAAAPKALPCKSSSASQTIPTVPKSTASQTNAALFNKQKPPSKTSVSSQTSSPSSHHTTTQTAVFESVAANTATQTSITQLQSSACQSTPCPSSSTDTQTTVCPTSTVSSQTTAGKSKKGKKQKPLSKESASSQTATPLSHSTTTQTIAIEPVVAEHATQTTTQLQTSSSVPPTPTTATSAPPEAVQPSCRLCESPNLDTNFTYHHLFSCLEHPSNTALIDEFIHEWGQSQRNADIFPDVLSLLAAVAVEDPTQTYSDSYTDLLSTATNILELNSIDPGSVDEILEDLQAMMSTIATDALTHLGLPNTTNLSAVYEFITNNTDDDASAAGPTRSEYHSMPDVAHPDDNWTNSSENDYDVCYDDDGYDYDEF